MPGYVHGASDQPLNGMTIGAYFERRPHRADLSLQPIAAPAWARKDNPMDVIVTYRGMVYPWHCDHLGHMNNMWYAGKFDEASWNLVLRMGFTPTYLRDAQRGLATVEQVTTFTHELLAGDVIEVRSEVVEVREKVMRIVHQMFKTETGELAATCAITGVHIDLAARKSCEIPRAIRATAERFLRTAKAA